MRWLYLQMHRNVVYKNVLIHKKNDFKIDRKKAIVRLTALL